MDLTTINSLASDPWITLGGFFIGLLGLVLAVVFYVKAKKDRVPIYELSSSTLIDGVDKTLEGLQLHYRGQPQSRITVTKIAFWNEGRETIDKGDLVGADPVRIDCPPDVAILDAQIIQLSSSSVQGALRPYVNSDGRQSYAIEFEYLDHRDYVVVQLAHNGHDAESFSIAGKIKGAPGVTRVTNGGVELGKRRLVPFGSLIDRMMANRLFMKYVGAGFYLIFAAIGTQLLLSGKTDWYVWVGTMFCILAATIMYSEFRVIPPVKI